MTVSLDSTKVTYIGNGVTTVFPFSFRVDQLVDLNVYLQTIDSGVATLLAPNVDYTVVGIPGTGSVTYTTSDGPVPATQRLIIVRIVPLLQGLDINNQGGFYPEAVEGQFDTVVMGLQQLEEGLDRTLQSPIGRPGYELPAADAGKLLGWSDDGTTLENRTDGITAVISALWTSVLALVTYAEAWLLLKLHGSLSTRTLIKALVPQVGMSVFLSEEGRAGNFVWTLGNFTARIAMDTVEGLYLKATSVSAGTGAWVRADYLAGSPANLRWFGAKGDGVTNDVTAIQVAVNILLAAAGGRLYVPGSTGDYICNSTVTINAAGASALQRYGAALTIYGDGPSRSCISAQALAAPLFYYTGDLLHNESHFRVENIRLTGNVGTPVAASVGLSIASAAWMTFDRCDVEGFDAGISFTDVDQVAVYNSNIRFNLRGIVCNTGVPITSPNSWTFVNTLIAGNKAYGIYVKNANAFTFLGGSVQYNGRIGVAGGWGVYLDEVGDGYGTALFAGTAFEGNGGLGDFVSTQTVNQAVVTFESVGFARTATAAGVAVTGAVNNGGGLIRLTLASTALFVTGTVLYVSGVGGVPNANGVWTVTVIDGTHIDLQVSAFAGAYTAGGLVTYYGFGTNNIYADGTNANAVYKISGCAFRTFAPYVANAARPSIALVNANAKINDDGTNYFQNATEKLTYLEGARIGDDGTPWSTTFVPAVSAAGGTFTATATMRQRKTGKRVDFTAKITVTSFTATPTAPVTMTLQYPAAADTSVSCINMTTVTGTSGIIGQALANVRIWQAGLFPFSANGQTMVITGSYETP